jgi:hypothetical protein
VADFGSLAPEPTPEETLRRNQPFINPASGNNFNTPLGTMDEFTFRNWLAQNRVPFNPDAKVSDYDMRGFYRGLTQENPRARAAVNPNDFQMHYPDFWKTPYHGTFSNGSQWAGPTAPMWTGDDKLVAPNGRIVLDEKARR